YDDSSSTNPVDAANLFSKFSSSIYTSSLFSDALSSNIKLPQFIRPYHQNYILDDVSKSLCSLRNIKSVGPIGLQGRFLFMLRDIIAWPLFLIFRKSIDSGVFPAALKFGSITPLFKSGDPKIITNYRPITILSHLSKIFESNAFQGFVLRSSSEFQLASPFKALYCALVRLLLEYGSVLWDPSTACASASIERVRRKFLRIAAYRLNIPHPPCDYSPFLRVLNLSSLADRRHVSNLSFLSNLLSSKIDFPFLLFLINFCVPSRTTRCSIPFYIPRSSSNYYENSPIVRLIRTANNDPSFAR
ncbi:putative RNA-directed DNA polymerase, partial [Aphis craccivora]